MKLLRVELSNFRQYKKQEILFPQKGLIGIRGDNGAGKSTLFNAISWAFYGKYDGVKNSQLRRQGSTTRNPCYVVVDFLYEDNFYRVKRSLSPSPAQNFVQCNGSSRAAGTTNLNDYIETDLWYLLTNRARFQMEHSGFINNKIIYYCPNIAEDDSLDNDSCPGYKFPHYIHGESERQRYIPYQLENSEYNHHYHKLLSIVVYPIS
jgi:hypothetical protein